MYKVNTLEHNEDYMAFGGLLYRESLDSMGKGLYCREFCLWFLCQINSHLILMITFTSHTIVRRSVRAECMHSSGEAYTVMSQLTTGWGRNETMHHGEVGWRIRNSTGIETLHPTAFLHRFSDQRRWKITTEITAYGIIAGDSPCCPYYFTMARNEIYTGQSSKGMLGGSCSPHCRILNKLST